MSLKTTYLTTFLLFSVVVFGQKTFDKKKSFAYNVEWTNIQNGSTFKDLIILRKVRGRVNGGQKKITWMTYPNPCVEKNISDSIFKLFNDSTCTSQCEKDWDKLNKGIITGTTGVIETKNRVWIHPPRIKYYKILEFAPFPSVRFDTTTFQSSIHLQKGWGKHEGINIKSAYYVNKVSETTYEISAKSTSSLGNSTLNLTFVKGKGFTEMEYVIFGTYQIRFWLD